MIGKAPSLSKVNELNLILDLFKIKANCTSHRKEGCVSIYEINLGPATRLKNIVKYEQEIALALKESAQSNISFNFEKGVVVLEFVSIKDIPSHNLKDIFHKKNDNGSVPILLGKDFYGKEVWMDMEDNPHLLVAGCTGSGKTVALHNIIGNIIANNSANLFLIDPKGTEFSPYLGLANVEVNRTYEEFVNLLDKLILTMENRFNLISRGYPLTSIKPIVLIIDEYGDLSIQDREKSMYRKLCSLAQKCRAAKIHIVLATQRPSAKLLDGNIKANFPARLACKVSSRIDSQVIIDESGAEKLMGKGDSILINSSHSKTRFKIAYSNFEQNKNL